MSNKWKIVGSHNSYKVMRTVSPENKNAICRIFGVEQYANIGAGNWEQCYELIINQAEEGDLYATFDDNGNMQPSQITYNKEWDKLHYLNLSKYNKNRTNG